MRTLLLTLCFWSTLSFAGKYPIVIEPFVNATPPGAKVSAGYFSLVNETETVISITGAYSPTIAKVEIHRSFIKDDVAVMERQESVEIQPGATVVFEHGGYHLMLMELTKQLEAGEVVDVILTTSVGDMMIEMPVQKIGMAMHGKKHQPTPENKDAESVTQTNAKIELNHQMKMEGDEQVSTK